MPVSALKSVLLPVLGLPMRAMRSGAPGGRRAGALAATPAAGATSPLPDCLPTAVMGRPRGLAPSAADPARASGARTAPAARLALRGEDGDARGDRRAEREARAAHFEEHAVTLVHDAHARPLAESEGAEPAGVGVAAGHRENGGAGARVARGERAG